MIGFHNKLIAGLMAGLLFTTVNSTESIGTESSYGQKHQMDSVVRLDHIPAGQGTRIASRLFLLPIGMFASILVLVLVFSHEEASRYTL